MSDADNSRTARHVVMLTVTFIWAASFIADVLLEEYSPSPYIHAAMMTILGALFGREIIGGRDGK